MPTAFLARVKTAVIYDKKDGALYIASEESKKEIGYTTFLILLAMIITAGFIQIGYILGQAALDKYVNAAVDIFDKDEKKDEK